MRVQSVDDAEGLGRAEVKTLFVGAYERENFGDLLFLHVTKALLGDSSSFTAGTPFFPHASSLSEHPMARYSDALAASQFDRTWVVGGEVGGTTLTDAYQMSASDADHAAFEAASTSERRQILEEASGSRWHAPAYMPVQPAPRSTYIVNSVGLYSVGGLRGRELVSALRALYGASFVSVRERHSHRLLSALGVRHSVAPDVVHALPATGLVSAGSKSPVALVQVRQQTLQELGPGRVAEVLCAAPSMRSLEIRLFRAGSARNHDSLALYEQVAHRIRQIDPRRPVSISTSVRSLDKAREIAAATLWVGTSLHGNIVSTAFGVARVGLANTKVDRYCATWREPMPYGVSLESLDSAVEEALGIVGTDAAAEYGQRMTQLAVDNFSRAASVAR